jgi:hypothetical protein
MPYASIHVVDTGGLTHWHTTITLMVVYFSVNWVQSYKKHGAYWKSWCYSIFIAILAFWGIWMKLSHLFLIPAYSIILIYTLLLGRPEVIKRKYRIRICIQGALSISIFVLLTYALLTGIDRNGRQYYRVLIEKESTSILPTFIDSIHRLLPFFWNSRKCLPYHVVPPAGIPWVGIIQNVTVVILLASGIIILAKRKKVLFPFIGISLFILTEVLIFSSKRPWAMHHIILGYPFIITTMYYLISSLRYNKLIRLIVLFFICAGIASYYDMARIHNTTDRAAYDYDEICNHINKNFAKSHLCIMSGDFYVLQYLWGPKEKCVGYIDEYFDEGKASFIKSWQKIMKRPIAFVIPEGYPFVMDWWKLTIEFPGLSVSSSLGENNWRVYYQGEYSDNDYEPKDVSIKEHPDNIGDDWTRIDINPANLKFIGNDWKISKNIIIQPNFCERMFSLFYYPNPKELENIDKYALVCDVETYLRGRRHSLYVYFIWGGRQCYWVLGDSASDYAQIYGAEDTFEINFQNKKALCFQPGVTYKLAFLINGEKLTCWINNDILFCLRCPMEYLHGVNCIGPKLIPRGMHLAGVNIKVPKLSIDEKPIIGFGTFWQGASFSQPHLMIP